MGSLILTVLFALFFKPSEHLDNQKFLQIEGIKEIQGNIAIMVFNDRDGFPKDESKAYLKKVIPVNKSQMKIALGDLPTGEYAISVIQDVNSNKKLDMNVLGIPKEPFGFSNNVSILLGVPGFNRAKITFDEMANSTTIKLIDLY